MARNGIWYEGRAINRPDTKGKPSMLLSKSRTGKFVLDVVVAEGFQEKNSKAPDEFKQPTRSADDYVDTYTAWHRVRVFADADDQAFIALVTNPLFNHGAVLEIEASYTEEKPWEDRGGKLHAGRRESIFFSSKKDEGGGSISIKVLGDGRVLGAREENAKPLYDGNFSALPDLGGSGGGGPAAPAYRDDEGF